MSRVDERLEQLRARYGLSEGGIRALRALLDHQACAEHAPTTVRAGGEAVDRHVADSLVALDLPFVRDARRLADIGSGAGWPGIALAAALPDTRVALVESARRRCLYLERAVAAASLANVEVVHARAEEWHAGLGANDVVTARAVASLPVLCEYAAPLLAPGGSLVAWKGVVEAAEATAGDRAAAELGLDPTEVRTVDPYPGAGVATLHVFRKVAPTPARFPRRPGAALKRPLGAA